MAFRKRLAAGLLVAAWAWPSAAQDGVRLERRYQEGDRSGYWMTGRNDDTTYQVRLTSVVKKGPDGRFHEEYAWSDLSVNGEPQQLPPYTEDFRVALSLDGLSAPFAPPDLSLVGPLTGPVLDLMTFYADLYLAMHQGELRQVGDSFRIPSPARGSWADGKRILRGEDVVNFEITLESVEDGAAEIFVRHLPPDEPALELPAEWMRYPVAEAANNWVQVVRSGGGYIAAVGVETFDVSLTVRLSDGKILAAKMENPVDQRIRECRDRALTDCGDARTARTYRAIQMQLDQK